MIGAFLNRNPKLFRILQLVPYVSEHLNHVTLHYLAFVSVALVR